MTFETLQAVKLGGSKGGPGASWSGSGCHGASVAKAGCQALEDGSGKEGEPKASEAERAGNIDPTAAPSIIRKRDVQDRWWILDSL